MSRHVTMILMPVFLIGRLCALSQDDSVALRNEALRQMNAGRYGEAINILNTYIASNPSSAEGYRLRGICFQNRSQLENAVNDLRRAAALDASDVIKSDLASAEAALKSSTNDKIEGYKRELARNPGAAAPCLAIARAYQGMNDWKASGQWFAEYFKRTEGSPEDVLLYCEVLSKTGDLAKGETILRRSMDRYPKRPDLLSRYGYFLLWQGKYQLSRSAFEEALAEKSGWKEAREGLNELRVREQAAKQADAAAQEARRQESAEAPVDHFQRLLKSTPSDDQVRLRLVNALLAVHRFDEAERHVDTLASLYVDSARIVELRTRTRAIRDSVLHESLRGYLEVLKENPANGQAALRAADAYAQLGDYGNAAHSLELYLAHVPDTSAADVRFRYAQYAAWNKQFDNALSTLTFLLERWPGNLDYQLLRGQISIWTAHDVDLGARYVSNVLRNNPGNANAMLAMSSLLALQHNMAGSREYLEKAKSTNAGIREIRAAEAFYNEALRAEAERATFGILTEARNLTAAGDCAGAIRNYEEYFARVHTPVKQVLREYADAQTCAKNLPKAISVCDQILQTGYDHDVAVQRAKNILWIGDSLRALAEFKRLREEKPSDFASTFYLAESYLRVRDYDHARQMLQELASTSTDENERDMVDSQMRRLPATGIGRVFSSFPTRVALAPPFAYYADNQDFQLMHYGARAEVGVTPFLSLGGSYLRTSLGSSLGKRMLDAAKGQAFIHISDQFALSGGAGRLRTAGGHSQVIGDAAFNYTRPGSLSVSGSFESTDAALILYSPYLIDLRYSAQLLIFSGWFKTSSNMIVSGTVKFIGVADGNRGREVNLSLGKTVFDSTVLGYEYRVLDYRNQSAYIPFTNRSRQLYYSPSNLESHSLWAEWPFEKSDEARLSLAGKIGWMPSYHAVIREISGTYALRPFGGLVIAGRATFGSTIRFESPYTYGAFQLSVYWSL